MHWDHPDNRLVLATGPLAGLPVWGTGGLTVVTRGALTDGATSTQANGFFGAALKYSGYDAIVVQGQAERLSYLYINDDTVEIRDAAHLAGKDTWETQQALEVEHGLSGHRMSVYAIGPAGENLVRFAAIHGDYGHVASKNGCGAVMGKKKLKAVCIVRGTKALVAHDPRGLIQAADEIAHDLKTDPSTNTLYNWGTLPGVSNLYKLGVLPIKNYTTNLTDVNMDEWTAVKLREGFDHRGHQCNACGMHHCHIQVIRDGPRRGELVDEPEYEGWSGRRLGHRPHRQAGRLVAEHAARPRVRRRQRVRLALRLGDGVHGQGLPHRAAGGLSPEVGRRRRRLSAPADAHATARASATCSPRA